MAFSRRSALRPSVLPNLFAWLGKRSGLRRTSDPHLQSLAAEAV
jgi:hypothetical protein